MRYVPLFIGVSPERWQLYLKWPLCVLILFVCIPFVDILFDFHSPLACPWNSFYLKWKYTLFEDMIEQISLIVHDIFKNNH